MNQNVVVAVSKISGKGVFANMTFKKGEIVMSWKPKKITKDKADSLPESLKNFVFILEGQYLYMQSPERYVNHSCDSNTKTVGATDVAVRDISKGEEITANYSGDGLLTFECKCQSENCRGLIS